MDLELSDLDESRLWDDYSKLIDKIWYIANELEHEIDTHKTTNSDIILLKECLDNYVDQIEIILNDEYKILFCDIFDNELKKSFLNKYNGMYSVGNEYLLEYFSMKVIFNKFVILFKGIKTLNMNIEYQNNFIKFWSNLRFIFNFSFEALAKSRINFYGSFERKIQLDVITSKSRFKFNPKMQFFELDLIKMNFDKSILEKVFFNIIHPLHQKVILNEFLLLLNEGKESLIPKLQANSVKHHEIVEQFYKANYPDEISQEHKGLESNIQHEEIGDTISKSNPELKNKHEKRKIKYFQELHKVYDQINPEDKSSPKVVLSRAEVKYLFELLASQDLIFNMNKGIYSYNQLYKIIQLLTGYSHLKLKVKLPKKEEKSFKSNKNTNDDDKNYKQNLKNKLQTIVDSIKV